jgi:hypothetical protein
MPTPEDVLATLLSRLGGVTSSGGGWSARCPAHDDRHASLMVAVGDDAPVVLHCHAGCAPDDVIRAVDMSWRDFGVEPYVVAEYHYQDADGNTLHVVQRWSDKRFLGVLPDLEHRVLYNWPWVQYAIATGQPVYVVEGEKDVDTLREFDLIGTCNPGGAASQRGDKKWLPQYNTMLTGADVRIIADNDDAGFRHSRIVAAELAGYARSVSLERPLAGKDVTQMLRSGWPISHTEPLAQGGKLGLVQAGTVRMTRVDWAWENYVPMGTLTLIDGDPGDGKSTLTMDLAARWSTGMDMPDGSTNPGPFNVAIVSLEDDPEHTIVPRLTAAGADLKRIHIVTSGTNPDSPFTLVDMPALADELREHDIRIVIIDPFMAVLPGSVNPYVDADVRRVLAQMAQYTKRLGVATIMVRHLTKSATKALFAGSGSIGIIGAARAAFMVKPQPIDPRRRVFVPLKTNLVAKPDALVYELVDAPLFGASAILWHGTDDITADEAFTGDREERTKTDSAVEWLEAILDNTWMTWKQLTAAGRANGYTEHTLRKAREKALTKVVNPSIGGMIALGTYWCRGDQRDAMFGLDAKPVTEGDGNGAFATDSDMANDGKRGNPATEGDALGKAVPEPEDPEEALSAKPLVCEVCGQAADDDHPVTKYGNPWWTVRCVPHNPFAFRDDKPGQPDASA